MTLFEIVLKMSSKVYVSTIGEGSHANVSTSHAGAKATLKILQAKHVLSMKNSNSISQLESLRIILEK